MSMSTFDSREWCKFFPADITTESDSALFIHRLFTVTLSALTAKRHIFSNDHFSSKKLGPLFVPLFTRPTSVVEQKRFNSTVFSWIQGVSQAISNGYLKLATFFIISKLDDSVLEIYEYYFAYNSSGIDDHNESFLSTTSIDDIQQQVLKALEQINQFVDERLKPIVNRSNYRFCLKIQYNTSITPNDYQPTGFVDSHEIISPINWKKILTTKITSSRRILAQIKTSHHKMLLVFRTPTMNSTMKK
ncbi:unnamed protein product [Rotaria sp. Silwood2]|nr:unnamed protein product [Rotaria sp. Silwood2]CAF2739869.1 unnamed protein product [Rotaria sp. Silwood2]CAF2986079.1 unnamed protein product [Rotaria sp. Silwood2]CAF3157133.1 unnamed protein product [Rotaria sp. Silwood2]CAF3974681.1 unnamed protein product [Rotaria sp. Silwood2]